MHRFSVPRSLLALALGLATAGCGAATSPTPTVPESESPSATSFVPRIARQDPGIWFISDIEVRGRRRLVARHGDRVTISDHPTGEVLDVHRIPGLIDLALDPDLEQACVVRLVASGVEVARLDLASRTEAWAREIPVPVETSHTFERYTRHRPSVFATGARCFVQWWIPSEREAHNLAFDGATGTPVPSDVSIVYTGMPGPSRTVISADGARRYEMHHALLPAPFGPAEAWMVDPRDSSTLARLEPGVFWASCVRAGDEGDEVGVHPVEPADRRAYIERTSVARMIECEAEPMALHTPLTMFQHRPRSSELDPPVAQSEVWRALPDGRLLHHGASGLYVFDFAHRREPVRVAGAPALGRFVDYNSRAHPYEPVIPPDGAWIGVIDAGAEARIVRWDTRTLDALPSIALPGPSRGDASRGVDWQVFAGTGERFVAIAELSPTRRQLFVRQASGEWTRSPVRAFPGVFQHAEWLEDLGRWLITCPHYGLQSIDPTTGRVLTAFMPEPLYSRVSVPARSPDGSRIAVRVDGDVTRDDVGLWVLDAETLAVSARLPLEERVPSFHALRWDEEGLFAATASEALIARPMFVRIDPATGAHRILGFGSMRWLDEMSYAAGRDVHRGPYEQAIVSAPSDAGETLVGIVEGDGFVELPDGRVWCEARACEHFRCVVAPDTLAPLDDPACASLRVLGE